MRLQVVEFYCPLVNGYGLGVALEFHHVRFERVVQHPLESLGFSVSVDDVSGSVQNFGCLFLLQTFHSFSLPGKYGDGRGT